ncbi:MAG: TIGR02253 family HAD-type hydrolase [Planctomycetota bacterium]|nr:TIGR02253 family HAD-type hydrolase [Planctomycetota bacterium]
MQKQKLSAIFFDIDDTLYSTYEFSEMAREAALDAMIKLGLKTPKEQLKQELDEIVEEFSSNYEHHFDKLLLRIPKRYYKNINPSILVASAVVAYHDTKFRHLRPYEDVVEVLKLLYNTELILGVITAGFTVKQAEKLVRLKVLPYITPNAIFLSDELGISKPNVKLYLRACSDLNLKPSECMYIGDNPLTDIDPPKKIGMIAVRNMRSSKHLHVQGKFPPDYEIHNFWDLLDILREDFGLKV